MEARQRVASVYIGKYFFRPMLPFKLSTDVCSLALNKPRLAISLFFDIDEEGLIDMDSISYRKSIIKSSI